MVNNQSFSITKIHLFKFLLNNKLIDTDHIYCVSYIHPVVDVLSYECKGGDSVKKITFKHLAAAVTTAAFVAPLAALAQVNTGEYPTLASEFGLGSNTDVKTVIIQIIKLLLGFLGLVAVIIVLYGGFQWMTAAGNEERVTSARATLTAGLIGLIIILSAYAIASFVITTVIQQTA